MHLLTFLFLYYIITLLMLEDFIEVNELKARIVEKRILNSSSAKCELIMREPLSLKPLLAIHLCKDSIDMEKIRKFFSDKLRVAESREAFQVTGYEKDYMPPISIYGVIVILDEKAANKEKLYFLVGEERTLIIEPKEIIEANEECVVLQITG